MYYNFQRCTNHLSSVVHNSTLNYFLFVVENQITEVHFKKEAIDVLINDILNFLLMYKPRLTSLSDVF